MTRLAYLFAVIPIAVLAGGSNYGITPDAHPDLAGKVTEWPVPTPRFARDPAPGPDGNIYIPAAMKVVREYQLPGGDAGPYAVTIYGGGMVWANEINTDTVVRLNPVNGEMRVVRLPSKNAGIRKMVVDAGGKLWYMGSHNGRLGVVE